MTNGSSSVAREPAVRLMEREQFRARVTDALGGSLRLVPVVAVLVVLGVVFAILSPFFLTPRNITFLFLQTVPIGLLGLSLIFVLFVAEIDLSLAIVSAVTAAIAVTLLVTFDFPIAVSLLAALTAGAGIGAIQAVIILVFGAPSFLVTLGVSFVLAGVLVLILPVQSAQVSILGTPLDGVQSAFLPIWGGWLACAAGIAYMFLLRIVHYRGLVAHGIGRGVLVHVILPIAPISIALVLITWHMSQYRGVPWILFSFLLLLAGLSYLISETAFGRHVMAVGGNREAARRAGVKVDRIVITTFAIAGTIAACGGLAQAARQLSVSSSSGGGLLLLSAIAGAVIGGASLFGGRGTVWAALLGPLVIGTINNGLDLLGAPPYLRIISVGSILVFAVILDAILVRGRLTTRRKR